MSQIGSEVGQVAPSFQLRDAKGESFSLEAQRGRPVVLLFYPGDDTPVCTKQLCSVRNNWSRYQTYGAEVVGINTDSEEAHKKFIQNHQLPLRLLVDGDGSVVKAYGMRSLLGVKRGVVVIDEAGIVRYRKTVVPIFRPDEEEVFEVLESLKKAR
ncbi:MAG: peroxiredoxin [Myxococcota bacterium]